MSEWQDEAHASGYLARADTVPHRAVGEAILLEELPVTTRRVLDLGTGDGRLLARVLEAHPDAEGVAIDFSPPLLERARARFAGQPRVQVLEHDLSDRLPELGRFDAVVSSFAIHHLEHPRKRSLYEEIRTVLQPGGVFCNLEHVEPSSARAHERFLEAMDITAADEDPSNKLLAVETQLTWLREIGFEEVDCYWRWRELALLVGRRAV